MKPNKDIRASFNDSKPENADKSPQNMVIPTIRDKDGSGYDIFSLLLKDNTLIVSGQVDTNMANVVIAQLKYLDHKIQNKDAKDTSGDEIIMLINSPGGSVLDGLAIYDIMREMKTPIVTVGNGMQASMGSILMAGGDNRQMYNNSMLLVHQIMGGADRGTQHTDFEGSAAFMALQHEKLKNVYVEFTGLNHKFWDVVGERDTWITADQAKKIGYIHSIVENEKPGGNYKADAIRAESSSLKSAMDKVAQDYIKKMSADDVVKVINNGSADGGVYARLRGELITRLAEFPEFWTESRKAEMAAKASIAASANDNKGVDAEYSAPKKKKANDAPKA